MLKARIFRVMAAGLVGVLAAGTALLGTSIVAKGSTARPSPVPASMTLNEMNQITAQARQMAVATAIARPARIGWLIAVQCYCLFADERTFQDTLAAIFGVAGLLDGMNVRVQPNTWIKLNNSSAPRIPDIYYFRLNNVHPASGLGYINELKVGQHDRGVPHGLPDALTPVSFQKGPDEPRGRPVRVFSRDRGRATLPARDG